MIRLILCVEVLHKLGSLNARCIYFCIFTTAESRAKILCQLNAFKPPPYTHVMASATVHSKALVLLLLIHFFTCADPEVLSGGSNFDVFFS